MKLWGIFNHGVRILDVGSAHKDHIENTIAEAKQNGIDTSGMTIEMYETGPSRGDLMKEAVIDALANPENSKAAIKRISELYNIKPKEEVGNE